MIEFLEGKYRSPFCHECREDPERMKIAMRFDGEKSKNRKPVQELICDGCNQRLRWWWFAKLPLTQEEVDTVMSKPIRPGRAF